MFYHAARGGLVDPARSVQVGLRTTNDNVMGFQVLDAREVHRSIPEQIAERIRARVGEHPVYLTFDIDCLDPAFAPAPAHRCAAAFAAIRRWRYCAVCAGSTWSAWTWSK